MDTTTDTQSLIERVQQLENENDELRKYVDQLCTQQAGPSYLLFANRMHFQRTAGLEQEVKKLQKEFAESTRDNLNLKEELSEASQIKIKLEELHEEEARKKLEAEKQLKFFQGSITAAFADRDKALAEAEIAKEKEELMSQTLYDCQMRLEQIKSDAIEAQEHISRLQIDLAKEKRENVVDKFFQIRQQCSFDRETAELSYLDVCSHLLHDPMEKWSFNYHKETDATAQRNVSALMHLQQQEERHLHERNETAALLENLGELQRSFMQVTAEKMDALMKLEHLERELLLGKFPEKPLAVGKHRAVTSTRKEGRFKDLLRRTTSLKRFIGVADFDSPETSFHPFGRGSISLRRPSNNMDMSRMKIEISTLKESMQILEDLTSGIHKLRVSLVKIREACSYGGESGDDLMKSIDRIINEANIAQTSLCSPLPPADGIVREDEKTKTVSAAGFEMVELLLLAAHTIKDKASVTVS